ncbi:MAG: hypothetical protein QXT25_01295 [Candidatus Anstonellaceae archaeon]
MKIEIIHQPLSFENKGTTIFDHLKQIVQFAINFAGKLSWKTLIGHASKAGIELIRPSLEEFLSYDSTVSFIIGLDYDKDMFKTVKKLWSLQNELQQKFSPNKFEISIFLSPNKKEILHIKMHWLSAQNTNDERHYILFGSPNLSSGGLRKNAELAACLHLSRKDKEQIVQFEKIWEKYKTSKNSIPLSKYIHSKLSWH